MAVTRLTDVFVHDVYGSYGAVNTPETTAIYESGIIVRSELLDTIARDGGRQAILPFWNDLDHTSEPNYSNDDPSDLATADNVTAGTMIARKAWLNKGYGEMDIIQELAGSSPLQHIRNRFGTYWTFQWQKRLVASARGVMDNNVDDDASDMTVDISGESGAAAVFNKDAFLDAAYTMGDRVEGLAAILVHSQIMKRMTKNNEIEFIPDANGNLTIPTYAGVRVIMNDEPQLVISAGVYLSILFGPGGFGFGGVDGSAFAAGEGIPKVPFEVWRDPHPGNGGGTEEIWERKTWIVHPFGFSWLEPQGSPGLPEFSPTLADLRDGDNWNRVVPRKSVPMAFMITRADAIPASP